MKNYTVALGLIFATAAHAETTKEICYVEARVAETAQFYREWDRKTSKAQVLKQLPDDVKNGVVFGVSELPENWQVIVGYAFFQYGPEVEPADVSMNV